MSPDSYTGIREQVTDLLTRLRSDASKLELTLRGGGPVLFADAADWSSAESFEEIGPEQTVWDFVLIHASDDGVELDRAALAVRDRLSPDALVGVDSSTAVDGLPGYDVIPSEGGSLAVFQQSRDPFQSRTVITIVPVRVHDGQLEVFVQRRIAGGFADPREMELLEFPQGHLEIDEDPLVAAARELHEEAGLVLGRVHGSSFQHVEMAEVSRPFAVVSMMSSLGLVTLAYVATVVAIEEQLSAVDSHGEWMPIERLEVACKAGDVYELNVPLVAILATQQSELEIWTAQQPET